MFAYSRFVILFIGLMVSAQFTMYTKSACIIIHGTWAKSETWYRPQGDFFKAVQNCNFELGIVDDVISFSWSGKLGHLAHVSAAQELAKKIEAYDFVILIGHSHGVTVGILASKILAEKFSGMSDFYKIAKFYALGCPVDVARQIFPDMSVIGKFYNLFSFGDYVQPVNLVYARCFADHERIANISVTLGKEHPNHEELHHPVLARELLKIEEYFLEKKLKNFERFSFQYPGTISFFYYELPQYEIQYDQKQLIELDKKVHWLATMAFFRSSKTGENYPGESD